MANSLSPLSKDQIDDLFSEINGLLEAEFQEKSEPKIEIQNLDVIPTTETFNKADVLKCLRILEPNSYIFYQDLQVCVFTFSSVII